MFGKLDICSSDDDPKTYSDDAGLTILELMIVLVILSLIGVVVSVQVIGQLDRAKVDVARLQLNQLSSGLELFYLDIGRYPIADEGLKSLRVAPDDLTNWRGPYIAREDLLTDPWGNPVNYQSGNDRSYRLVSFGADGKEGGDGANQDIVSANS